MSNGTKNARLGCALAAVLGAAALAQDAHPLLAKAKVVEEAEFDLVEAAVLYRRIAGDDSLDPAARSEALLRLAKVQRKLGQDAAADQALKDAAQGVGPAADEARALLEAPQDPARGDRSVELEILRLMTAMRGDDTAKQVAIREQIAWYGQRAVPLLVEAVATESDYGFVTTCARTLFRIGGDAVDRWIVRATGYEDALRRRAVVRAAHDASEAQKRRLAGFLGDPAPEVRMQAVQSDVLLEWTQLVPVLRDQDRRVRSEGLSWFRGWKSTTSAGSGQSLRPGELPPADRRARVIGELLDAILALDGEVDVPDTWVLGDKLMLGIAAVDDVEARFALALRLAVARSIPLVRVKAYIELQGRLVVPPGTRDLLVAELRAAARELASYEPTHDHDVHGDLVKHVAEQLVPTWTREHVGDAIDVLECGYGFDVDWFARVAAPSDWVTIFERLPAFESVPGYSAGFLTQQIQASIPLELPDAAWAPLRRWTETQLALEGKPPGEWAEVALVRLGRFDSDDALAWTVEMLTRTGDRSFRPRPGEGGATWYRDALFQGLISGGGDARRDAIRSLAVAEGHDLGPLRNLALRAIAFSHDVGAAPLFAEAYRLGLSATRPVDPWGVTIRDAPQSDSLGLASISNPFGFLRQPLQDRQWTPSWTDAERARAIEPCLALDDAAVWNAAIGIATLDGVSATSALFVERWQDCRDSEVRFGLVYRFAQDDVAIPARRRVLIGALGDPEPSIRRQAFQAASRRLEVWNDDLQAAVVAQLASADAESVSAAIGLLARARVLGATDRIAGFLDHDSLQVRRSAVDALFSLDPEHALERCFEALKAVDMRWTMVETAKRTLDRRFVPLLIGALRDPSETTRSGAKSALEAIEFYVSQAQRWQRLLDDAGLDSPSAAEALIRQARTADDRRVRLAAIRSLGTLAVPETLPFLIQLMQDDDAEIVDAAAAAVERINAK